MGTQKILEKFLMIGTCTLATWAFSISEYTAIESSGNQTFRISDYFHNEAQTKGPAKGPRIQTPPGQISFKMTESAGSGTTFSSIAIGFFTSTDCTGTASNTVTLGNSITLSANTYQSTNASNYALCQQQTGSSTTGGVCTPNSGISSITFTYSYTDNALSSNSITAVQCLMNTNLSSSCTSSSCGFTTSLNTINLTPLSIFISIRNSNGAMGGSPIAGADTVCQTDASSSLYNAIVVGKNTNGSACRQACTNSGSGPGNTNCGTGTNWVMQPNQVYINYYNQAFLWLTNNDGVTDSFNFFTNAITQTDGGGARETWTGLNVDWTTNANTCQSGGTGKSWNSSSPSSSGSVGFAFASSTGDVLDITTNFCSSFNNFICVQQPTVLTSPTCS